MKNPKKKRRKKKRTYPTLHHPTLPYPTHPFPGVLIICTTPPTLPYPSLPHNLPCPLPYPTQLIICTTLSHPPTQPYLSIPSTLPYRSPKRTLTRLRLGLGTAYRNGTAVYRCTLPRTAVRTTVYRNSNKLTVIVNLSAAVGIHSLDMATSHGV